MKIMNRWYGVVYCIAKMNGLMMDEWLVFSVLSVLPSKCVVLGVRFCGLVYHTFVPASEFSFDVFLFLGSRFLHAH